MNTTTTLRGLGLVLAAAALSTTATVALTSAPHADAGTKIIKPTAADKRAMVRANITCAGAPDETVFEDCAVGAFMLDRGRWINSDMFTADYTRDPKHFIVLTQHSKKLPESYKTH
jgi:hypothetical protein